MKNPLTRWRDRPLSRRQTHPFSAMESAFDRFLEDFHQAFNSPMARWGDWENEQLSPSVDIIDAQDTYRIEAEVPGMGPEDLKIKIINHALIIEGKKTVSRKDKDRHYTMREIAYGAYYRSIPLPELVDTTQAKATFKKGMLWVDIPKKTDATESYRDIPVEMLE
jgi:HSP20 family protein